MEPIYRGWHCDDCGRNCDDEYYWLRSEVWEAAGMMHMGPGFLCVGCLEERLRRPLVGADFVHIDPAGSERLQARGKALSALLRPSQV
jgi:hypothetical protein